MKRKLLRYCLKTIAWILGIIVLAWIALWTYVELNEARLIGKISSAIHERTRGQVSIGGASVSLIKTFPVLSLQLSDVLLRDSLYSVHGKDFLTAKDIYLRISLQSLIEGKTALSRVTINNGSLNIITDSLGRSNDYVLKEQKKPEATERSSVPVIILNNMMIGFQNPVRRKDYQVQIRSLKCAVVAEEKSVGIGISMNALVKSLTFNTRKGSYIKEKNVSGRFQLYYNKEKHDLLINHATLNIGGHPFQFDGYFRIDKNASDYNLVIETKDIDFEAARSMLTDSLGAKLAAYAFGKPLSPRVTITGMSAHGNVPDVRIEMAVKMESIKSLAGITSLQFNKGNADVDITVVSSDKAKDSLHGDLNGTVRLDNAEIKYVPRDFLLKNCTGTVKFDDSDILVDSFSAVTGQTKLMMTGRTKNIITLGNGNPGKMIMRWNLSSPQVHIKDFKAFVSKGKSSAKQSTLDKMFEAGDVYVVMATPKMDYNHFIATNVKAELILRESAVQLQKVFFNHANGYMTLDGELRNGNKLNPVSLHTTMTDMDIPLLFAAFDNFGQDALTKSNLKGKLTADVIFNTSLTNKADVVGSDSKGTVNFLLQNGELNNFTPLEEVGKKAFKKQDFSQIRFADLKNKLNISGTTFIVNPMEIRSTALTLFVEGIYDVKKGTDMSIRFPLRNLTKSQANTDLTDEGTGKKGISLRLRAKTGDDGKLKVSWDPFRRSIKNRDGIRDSLDIGKRNVIDN